MKLSDLPREGTTRWRMRALRHRLGPLFPETAEGRLWFAVFMQAAEDASGFVQGQMNKFFAADGLRYLTEGPIAACEACGVDSSYARRVLRDVGVLR